MGSWSCSQALRCCTSRERSEACWKVLRQHSPAVQLARMAFAGAVVGAAGIATAIVMVGGATSDGADTDPVVSRAVDNCVGRPGISSPRRDSPRCSAPLDY